ncbi:MAG: RimK family alpha-L-glutamate ligase [Eubacterium sp.]|nr:RimK family alpha-L-glutamate ligase [Eubacterium sp.]
MKAYLAVNHYLKSEKFDKLHGHIIKSAASLGVDMQIKTNQELIFSNEKPDFVLFWDKDVNTARLLEKRDIQIFNSASSIALCDDKAKTCLALKGCVPQPETIIAPLAFGEADYSEFVHLASEKLGFPLIYKECFGSFGERVFLCKSESEITSHINGKPFLLQEFIADSEGEDIRIEIVGGKAVAAMKRKNKNNFRSNITNGGVAEAYEPTRDEIFLAENACKRLGLTFGGVDILKGGLVCEVNSNAHIMNLLEVTGIDVAPIIIKHIIDELL